MSGPTRYLTLVTLALLCTGALGRPCAGSPAPSDSAAASRNISALRTVWSFDRAALEAAGISRPSRLAYDPQGNLYVLDSETRRVVKLDPKGRPLYGVGGYGDDDASLQMPVDIVVDHNESLLVLDRSRGALVAFDRTGRFLGLRPFQGAAQEEAHARGARILLDSFGTLWLLATQAHDLWPLTGRLEPARSARFLTPEESVGVPSAAALDADGAVWLHDAAGGRLRRFTSSGRFQLLAAFADSAGSSASADLSVDGAGNLYVADAAAQRILIFGPSGALRFARVMGGARIPWRPMALALSSSGSLAVADAERNEIQVLAVEHEAAP